MNMPRFTATRSLVRSSRRHGSVAREWDRDRTKCAVVTADVPGGPGNVPIGYNRECTRVPYVVCDLHGCRTEYAWECTFTPIRRAQ